MQQQPFGGEQKWDLEHDEIQRMADEERKVHEAERIHAEEAAEDGAAPVTKKPWWKFWGR
jgi:hypothetical protein